jgi:hypothetical protein
MARLQRYSPTVLAMALRVHLEAMLQALLVGLLDVVIDAVCCLKQSLDCWLGCVAALRRWNSAVVFGVPNSVGSCVHQQGWQ